MKLGLFIFVETYSLDEEKSYYYSSTGDYVYQIGSVLPVIYPGRGCVGLGKVTSIEKNEATTKVTFTFYDVKDSAKNAYYTLYKANIDDSATENYDETDADFVPGVFRPTPNKKNKNKNRNSYL